MSETITGVELESLLADTAWLSRLARGLVAHDSDDLVQETLIVATEKAPRDRPIKPWLVGVMRNLARMRWRSEKRRATREQRAHIEPAPAAGPRDALERLELQQILTRLVLELGESYRSVIVLHYVEGLSSREIARRLGIASGTVRWRLKQAVDVLRAQLDDRDEKGRAAWIGPVMALASKPSAAPVAVGIGAIAMKKIAIALAALFVLLAIALLSVRLATRAEPQGETETTASRNQSASSVEAALPPWVDRTSGPKARVAGVVYDANGNLAAGALVRLQPSHRYNSPPSATAEVLADDRGRFDFGAQPRAAYFVVASRALASPTSAAIHLGNPRPATPHDELVLRLGGCLGQMRGVVRDVGGPIAGANIRVGDQHAPRSSLAAVAVSDASGGFSVCTNIGAAVVRVDADGYGAAEIELDHIGLLVHDFVLVPEGVIDGRVLTGDGSPVEGARVVATPAVPRSPNGGEKRAARATVADSQGRFAIEGLAAGPYRIAAASRGLSGAIAAPVVVAAGERRSINVTVDGAAELTGRVLEDGVPVVGVEVSIHPLVHGATEPAITNTDGRFVMTAVPREELIVEVAGFQVDRPLSVVVGDDTEPIDIEVSRLGAIEGRVVRDGVPVPAAFVYPTNRAPLRADSEGRFRIEGLHPGRIGLSAASPTFGESSHFELTQVKNGVTRVELKLSNALSIAGVVTNAHNEPVASAYVRVHSLEGGMGSECSTDSLGSFQCAGLPSGAVRLEVYPTPVSAKPFPDLGGGGRLVIAENDLTNVRVRVETGTKILRGQALNDTGDPVADAIVSVLGAEPGFSRARVSPTARTDQQGRFSIKGLVDGPYSLRARAAGGLGRLDLSSVPTDEISIVLLEFGSIAGVVRGFGDQLRIAARGGDLRDHWIEYARIDGERFRFDGLAAGTFVVSAVSGRGGAELDALRVEVRPGETTSAVLENRGTAAIEGRVTDLEGTPVAGLLCNATGSVDGARINNIILAHPSQTDRVTTDEGRFFIDRAPAGPTVRVECWSPDIAITSAALDLPVAKGETTPAALRVVRRHEGDPSSGISLHPLTIPARIGNIEPGSIAARADLASGDVILSVDGQPLTGLSEQGVLALIGHRLASGTVSLRIERAGLKRSTSLVPK